MRRHHQDRAERRDTLPAHAGDKDVPGAAIHRLGQCRIGQHTIRRRDGLGLRGLCAHQRDEGRAETLHAGQILVAGGLVDPALAAPRRRQRLHRDAVGDAGTFAAILADAGIDHGAARGRRGGAALALAAAFGRAFLVVDQRGDARHLAQRLLHRIQLRTRVEGDAGRDFRIAPVAVRIVGDDGDAAHTLRPDLGGDARHAEIAFDMLPAGHRDGGIHQHLVGDVRPARDGGAQRERAAMRPGPVADIDEDVLLIREGRDAEPGRAFPTHLGEGAGLAFRHLGDEPMAADAGQAARALGHPRAGVVRAAWTEEGIARDQRVRGTTFQRLDLPQPGGKRLGAKRVRQARRQRTQNLCGIKLAKFGQQRRPALIPLADQARARGQGIERVLQLRFDEGAAILNHQHFLQPLREGACAFGIERPGQPDLPDAKPIRARKIGRDAGIGQRLAQRGEGLAAHGDAEAGIRAVDNHAVEAIGPREGAGRRQLEQAQAPFLRDSRIGDAKVDAILRHVEARRGGGIGGRIDAQRRAGIHRLGHAFHRGPGSGEAAERDSLHAEFQHLRDLGRVEQRDLHILEAELAAGGDGGGFGGRIVARQRQHTAFRRGAGGIGVAQRIPAAIRARALAVPDAEHALMPRAGGQRDLLRAPDRRRGQILVQAGVEDDMRRLQPRCFLQQQLVVATDGGAAIAADIARRVPAQRGIHLPAQQRQAHQRLDARHHDGLARRIPSVFERGFGPLQAAHGTSPGFRPATMGSQGRLGQRTRPLWAAGVSPRGEPRGPRWTRRRPHPPHRPGARSA